MDGSCYSWMGKILKLRTLIPVFAALAFLCRLAAIAIAGTTASHAVTITTVMKLKGLETLLVFGNVTLTIEEVDTPVTDNSTVISYRTNPPTKKITAELQSALPSGVTLKIQVQDGEPEQTLSTTAVDVLRELYQASGDKIITYQSTADITVTPQMVNAVVIFTLTSQ